LQILRIDLDLQNYIYLAPAKKKKTQNKTLQKLSPSSQIKNSAFNGLVPLGRYK